MTDEPFDEAERALLADLLAGERSETEPEVADRLQRNPALRAELAALRELASGLDRGGEERALELEEARSAVTPDDVAAARRALDALPNGSHRPLRRFWIAIAAAAAALLLAMLLFGPRPKEPGGSGSNNPRLGTGTIRDDIRISPRDNEPFEAFTWRALGTKPVVPDGGYLRLVVFRVRDGRKTSDKLFEKGELEGDGWQPSPAQLQQLRQAGEFWWELWAVDSDQTERLVQQAQVRVVKIGGLGPPRTADPVARLASLLPHGLEERAGRC